MAAILQVLWSNGHSDEVIL